jgi:aminoglycoside 3-N-acetyltransferase
MKIRDIIRSLAPTFLLKAYRQKQKAKQRQFLQNQKLNGEIWTKNDLITQFQTIGIKKGDVLLVHSSLSKIGFIENGPKDFVDALLETVGSEGHILMPNSPNASFQLDYIQQLSVFDVQNDVSKLGAITEYFRKLPNAIRSEHPTEPVSCVGPNAAFFVGNHYGNITPYNEKSPFYKVSQMNGKILYVGVTLDNAGTNLHTLEDAIFDFKFPVYHEEIFDVKVKSIDGTIKSMQTKVHNPVWSKKRQCDELLPLFEAANVAQKVKIGNAETWLFDAKKMLDVMIDEYQKNGVTMYTPKGN